MRVLLALLLPGQASPQADPVPSLIEKLSSEKAEERREAQVALERTLVQAGFDGVLQDDRIVLQRSESNIKFWDQWWEPRKRKR